MDGVEENGTEVGGSGAVDPMLSKIFLLIVQADVGC